MGLGPRMKNRAIYLITYIHSPLSMTGGTKKPYPVMGPSLGQSIFALIGFVLKS